MVALGTAISAFWILSVNSWMQTPVGWAINDVGQFVPAAGWLEIIFNPSFPYRLVHTVIAAYLTTALVVGGVGAWHLLKEGRVLANNPAHPEEPLSEDEAASRRTHGLVLRDGPSPSSVPPQDERYVEALSNPAVRKMFSMALWMAALVAPVQIFVGDLHGLNTLEHQPAKVMAMEGHFESYPNGAPLILLGHPDSKAEKTHVLLEIPKLSSLILKHDANAPLAGLKTVPKADRPPAEIVFWSFRVMVGLGMLMLLLGLWSLAARLRKKLYAWKWLHRFALVMGPSGFVAVIAGWITTEVGRQPWVVYGLLRTANARAPIDAPAVATSLIAFVIVYFAVFGAGTWYILKLMAHPPHTGESGEARAPIRTAGITPSASMRRPGADPRPDRTEEAE
jgi:cytochrome d ubiquinol oxidase subunit I